MGKRKMFKSIRFKLLSVIMGLMVVLLTFFLVKDYRSRLEAFNQGEMSKLSARYGQVKEIIADSNFAVYSMAVWVANMPEVQKTFAKKDRKGLRNLMLPVYRSVKETLNISQFQFHLPPATSFLRLHRPEKYGDDLSRIRPTVISANRDKKAVIGLEKGRAGFGLRAVVPVSYRGKHIGTVEFGRGLNDHLIQPLKKQFNFDAIILVPDGPDFKVQARTGNIIPVTAMHPVLHDIMETGREKIFRYADGGAKFMAFLAPLRNYSGKVVGVIAIPDNVTAAVSHMRNVLFWFIGAGLLAAIVILAVVYIFTERMINRPLGQIVKALMNAGDGDLTCRLDIRNEDEMGRLGEGFNAYLERTRSVLQSISDNSDVLATASRELAGLSQQMTAGAEETSVRSNAVATASEEMSSNMNSVAAAAEEASTNVGLVATAAGEMASTINEIAQNTEKARDITSNAVSEAVVASEKVNELGKAAKEIGKVTETITEISEQTNLLALNATIEAARAGEAGKGFAVVANEIKDLARQTAGATGEIEQKIRGIQASTDGTVTQIDQISRVVNDVNEIITTISTAVDEQFATTKEIANNVSEASQGIGEVTENVAQSSTVAGEIARDIADVSQAANEITSSSAQVNMSAGELSRLAGELKEMVGKFKTHV